MLKRLSDPPPPGDRHRRHRARVKAGIAVAPVEFDATVVNFLVRLAWLPPGETHDRASIGRAISAMVSDAAQR